MGTKRRREITERSRELNRNAQRRSRAAKRRQSTWDDDSMSRDPTLDASFTTEHSTGLSPAAEGHRTGPVPFHVMQHAAFGNLSPLDTAVGTGLGAAEPSAGGFFHDAMALCSSASSDLQNPYPWVPSDHGCHQRLDYCSLPMGMTDYTGAAWVDESYPAVSIQPFPSSLVDPALHTGSCAALLTPQPENDYDRRNRELTDGTQPAEGSIGNDLFNPNENWHDGRPGAYGFQALKDLYEQAEMRLLAALVSMKDYEVAAHAAIDGGMGADVIRS